MNKIIQHIPAFVETGNEPRASAEFASLEQLMEIPFVKIWTESKDFYQFSISGRHLIAEERGGRAWWVVGFLREFVFGLPEWNEGIYEVIDKTGKPLEVSGKDVSYSQGNVVGLKDGRIMRRQRGAV